MPFITGMEQRGIDKGFQMGLEHEKKKIAQGMLSQGLDRALIKRLTELSDEELDELIRNH